MNNIIPLVVFFVLLIALIVIYYYICICSKNSYKIGSDEIYGSGIFSYFNRSAQSASNPYKDINNTKTEHVYSYSGDPKKTKNPFWLDANIVKLQSVYKKDTHDDGTNITFDEKQKIADEIEYNDRLIKDYIRETKNMYQPNNRHGY